MKVRIEEIRLQNYRAFESARLRLGDLTFLVGRNGAGKSSLLDAVEFMREALTDSLPNALDRREGLVNLHRRVTEPNAAPMGLAVILTAELGAPTASVSRSPSGPQLGPVTGSASGPRRGSVTQSASGPRRGSVTATASGTRSASAAASVGRPIRLLYGFQVGGDGSKIEEVLRVEGKDTLGFVRHNETFRTEVPNLDPAVPRGRLMLPLVAGEQLWALTLDALRAMRGYELVSERIAESQKILDVPSLDRDGGNAANVLEQIRQSRPEDETFIRETLEAVLPGLLRIGTSVRDGRRRIVVEQTLDRGVEGFWGGAVSSGTWRALGILLALRQRPTPSLLVIDEIEDSIHPMALSALVEAAEVCADEFPVILTTHSPEVLSEHQVTPDRTRIVQWDNGHSALYPLSEGTAESVSTLTTVGDLLRMNGLWSASEPDNAAGDILAFDA
jgi:hypothetical protein